MAVIDHGDPVGYVHDFVQFEGDQKDGDAFIALIDQHLVDVLDRAYVQSSSRLDRDEKLGFIGDLAADDDLLLVAARKAACQPGTAVLGTNVICLDQFLSEGTHLLAVDPAAR